MSIIKKAKIFFKKKLFYLIIISLMLFFTIFVKSFNFYLQLTVLFIFLYFVVLSILISKRYSEVSRSEEFPKNPPKVAVVTYAYNNWKPIKHTIDQLKKLEYPIPYTIYVITDGTCTFLENDKRIKPIILDKKYFIDNRKAVIMNQGLKQIKEQLIFGVDGDTIPEKDALIKMIPSLKNDVGMVVGVMGVTNKKKFIEKLQTIEYNFSFGLPRMVLTAMGSLDIGTGAMCLLDKKIFDSVGGYDEENITEDKEIAYKFIKKGYKIHFVVDAKAKTEVPSTWKSYFIQRLRWARGGFDTNNKYLSFLFNRDLGVFGFYLPYSLGVMILSMMLVFRTLYHLISDLFFTIYYNLYNIILYGINLSDFSFNFSSFNISSLIIILLVSLSLSIYFMSLSFGYTDFKLDISYFFPILFFLFVYGFIIIFMYIIGIAYELIGVKQRW